MSNDIMTTEPTNALAILKNLPVGQYGKDDDFNALASGGGFLPRIMLMGANSGLVQEGKINQGCYALITDLKNRGMLSDTLILWHGEFGRTPMAQGNGRDHHIKGFSCWLAGGGVRGGMMHGSTDELGYNAEQNIVHVHDLHATMLHLLGIDHEKLTYRYGGRDFRLTDVSGRIVKEMLA